MPSSAQVAWVVLTMGDRAEALAAAVGSLAPDPVVVIGNGAPVELAAGDRVRVESTPTNVGVPGGRNRGVAITDADVIGFLDDDAEATSGAIIAVADAFADDPQLGAVALRIVDDDGTTARRHVPRFGGRDPAVGGDVALFLGGACAIRRAAYDDVGGYWTELFYGHEELELAWRLVDRGWRIRYLADAVVRHPRTGIRRHAHGWRLTGRNRVLVARRTLPWPVAVAHVGLWLLLGSVRALRDGALGPYVRGWVSGWRPRVDRAPISWRGVWRLTRLGRPPIL